MRPSSLSSSTSSIGRTFPRYAIDLNKTWTCNNNLALGSNVKLSWITHCFFPYLNVLCRAFQWDRASCLTVPAQCHHFFDDSLVFSLAAALPFSHVLRPLLTFISHHISCLTLFYFLQLATSFELLSNIIMDSKIKRKLYLLVSPMIYYLFIMSNYLNENDAATVMSYSLKITMSSQFQWPAC